MKEALLRTLFFVSVNLSLRIQLKPPSRVHNVFYNVYYTFMINYLFCPLKTDSVLRVLVYPCNRLKYVDIISGDKDNVSVFITR